MREALGDDPTTTGPVAGKAIDTESLGVMVRHPAISAVPPPRAARAAVVAAPVSGAPVRGPPRRPAPPPGASPYGCLLDTYKHTHNVCV